MAFPASLRAFSPVALATALAFLGTAPAQAITFEQLNADGSGSGLFYTPQLDAWVLAPDAAETSLTPSDSSWLIGVGTASYGASELDSQTSGIFGAGVLLPSSTHGWRIDFSANLRSWDSYNDGSVVAPNPGASLGDWDLFSVNANHQAFYWDLTSPYSSEGSGESSPSIAFAIAPAANGTLIDPLVPVRPAGTIVNYSNPGQPEYLPGSTWAWGGRDYAVGYFESVSTNGSVVLGGDQPTFVSFVLDTRTPAFNDTNFPSWGEFGPTGIFNELPGGSAGTGPGAAPANPLLPTTINPDTGAFEFAPFVIGDEFPLDQFLFIDPVVAIGYEYAISGGPSFTEILLPLLGDADGYGIELLINGNWTLVDQVADGGSYTFAEAVNGFRVVDIDPALALNPDSPVAFVTGIKVNEAGTIVLSMTPITAAVPEPATWALVFSGLVLTALSRRRRQAQA